MSDVVTRDEQRQLVQWYANVPDTAHPGAAVGLLHAADRRVYFDSLSESDPDLLRVELVRLAQVEGVSAAAACAGSMQAVTDALESLNPIVWREVVTQSPELSDFPVFSPGGADLDEFREWLSAGNRLPSDLLSRELDAMQMAHVLEAACGSDVKAWDVALLLTVQCEDLASLPGIMSSRRDRRRMLEAAGWSSSVAGWKSRLLPLVPERVTRAWLRAGVQRDVTLEMPFRPDYSWRLVKKLLDSPGAEQWVRGERNVRAVCRRHGIFVIFGHHVQSLAAYLPARDLRRGLKPGSGLDGAAVRRILAKHGPIPMSGSCTWVRQVTPLSNAAAHPVEYRFLAQGLRTLTRTLPHLGLTLEQRREVLSGTLAFHMAQAADDVFRVVQMALQTAPAEFYDVLLETLDPYRQTPLVFQARWPAPARQAEAVAAVFDEVTVSGAELAGGLIPTAPEAAALFLKSKLGTSRAKWALFMELLDGAANVGDLFEVVDAATE